MASEKHVALNLGVQSVNGAVFSEGKEGQLILEAYASNDLLADPSADATRLEQTEMAVGELVKALKIKNKPVRYAISSQSVFVRFVTLPPLDLEQVDQIVTFEAQQQAPFPLETAVWDYQTLGDPEDIEVEVALVAIKSDDLDEINHAVRANGLETATVDLAPMALYNAFRYNYPDFDQPVVLIDIGARTTNLIYVEGSKVFVRSVNVGGRDVTNNIAKEFDITFQEAEERKIQDGFVALGGSYADHDNAEIAAMSKVIRNSVTRLHSEVVRTNNYYRSNQGGSAPAIAFLCGSGAGLPYLNEFFQEKLKVPVEYFNALRNVRVGKKVDEATVTQNAHALGELVGLGLRGLGDCPMELDLVPRMIQREREAARRAPYFWLAGFSAAAMLAASGFFFQKAAGEAREKTQSLKDEVADLKDLASQIGEQEERFKAIKNRQEPYTNAAVDRVYWINLFQELNSRFVDDKVWFTELQPLSDGQSLLEKPVGGSTAGGGLETGEAIAGLTAPPDAAGEGKHTIDAIRLLGLYRDTPEGSQVVYNYLERLRESPYFDIADKPTADIITNIDPGVGGTKHALEFEMILPLERQISFTK